MIFNVNKDEAIQAIEVIIETQQSDEKVFDSNVVEKATQLLDLLMGLPIKCSKVMLTEEEAKFISIYYE